MLSSPPLFAILLLSASTLAYEVLLLRLFAIIQWHHFAYMIISLALLGYGASGTFLALMGQRTHHRFTTLFAIHAVLFAFSTVVSFLIVQQLSFNPLELLWDWHQLFYLSIMYLLLAMPFFFAANCIGISFYHFQEQIGRIYSADLVGAGLGALGIVLLLFLVSPLKALMIVGALGLVSATLSLWHGNPTASPLWKRKTKGRGGWLAVMLLATAVFVILFSGLSNSWMTLQISSYKGLSQLLQISGAQILTERSSPLGLVTVVESPKIPLRYAPGLSPNSPIEPPEQLGIFIDGGALTVINRYTDKRESLAYLDFLTSALPYHLLKQPTVLLLGAGGGSGVLQALYHHASHVDAVELNPQIIKLVQQDYSHFAGQLYQRNNVQIHRAEARGWVSSSKTYYDLIQVALLDSFGASSAGLYALSENYLYTIEALQQLINHLNPHGVLAITRWIKLPPRDSLKLLATAVAALTNLGITTPNEHIALIRGWKTSTLLIKNSPFTEPDIIALQRFCETRSFDVIYYPNISPQAPNQYNLLDQPYFYEGAMALLTSQSDTFIRQYKYDITPATDDHPYFFNFFKWPLLSELFAKRGSGGMGLLEWGYPVLIATLIQASFFSIILIIIALLITKTTSTKAENKLRSVPKIPILVYFLMIGLAFLFVEMAFIQKFTLFLSHPLYAVAIVLCAFLIFAGLGSRYVNHYQTRIKVGNNPTLYPVGSIATLALLYLALLPPLLHWLTPLPELAKIIISLLLIAPLAFWMGMPFPLGLSYLGNQAPYLIPWAWAINGCASVLSAVLATLLAIHFGFTVVILLAISFYGVAALAYFFINPLPGLSTRT